MTLYIRSFLKYSAPSPRIYGLIHKTLDLDKPFPNLCPLKCPLTFSSPFFPLLSLDIFDSSELRCGSKINFDIESFFKHILLLICEEN